MRKYILGWLTLAPGTREAFLASLDTYIAATRAEEGCLFFEMSPSRDDPDVVLLMECFADEAAHELHSKTDHQEWMRASLKRYMTGGRFENAYAERVVHHVVDEKAG